MSSIRGHVRSGNSGGPAVDRRGRVLATLFAATTGGTAGGYGVPNDAVRAALGRSSSPVGTGPCTAG
jgi:S1-C subfamily serine protease